MRLIDINKNCSLPYETTPLRIEYFQKQYELLAMMPNGQERIIATYANERIALIVMNVLIPHAYEMDDPVYIVPREEEVEAEAKRRGKII